MKRLEEYIVKGGRRLRLGYTTGSCAAAAAMAAACALLEGEAPRVVRLQTPYGILLELEVDELHWRGDSVFCAVRKDAGDDPDVTDGIRIGAAVSRISEGIRVEGGAGVGRVTLPGLPCPVGEAAINPAPLAAIRQALEQVRERAGYTGGLRAVISAEDGRSVAERTFNPRLGIEGGISILGTTGIVEPMSEAALVDAVKAEMAQRRANRRDTLLLTPGNYGRDFARAGLGMPPEEPVRCSNFIGEALDHAVYLGFSRLLLIGHMGKLVKLAAGVMCTHSRIADGRMDILTAHAALQGIGGEQAKALMACVTVDAADALLRDWGLAGAVWDSVGERIAFHLRARTGGRIQADFIGFLQRGAAVSSENADRILEDARREGERLEG